MYNENIIEGISLALSTEMIKPDKIACFGFSKKGYVVYSFTRTGKRQQYRECESREDMLKALDEIVLKETGMSALEYSDKYDKYARRF